MAICRKPPYAKRRRKSITNVEKRINYALDVEFYDTRRLGINLDRALMDRILPKDVAAEEILRERTLTNLYNRRPQWLIDAHSELDAVVADAYGWPIVNLRLKLGLTH